MHKQLRLPLSQLIPLQHNQMLLPGNQLIRLQRKQLLPLRHHPTRTRYRPTRTHRPVRLARNQPRHSPRLVRRRRLRAFEPEV